MAASAPCHNPTLFDLYFAYSTSSLFKPTTTAAVGGIASWVASTAAMPKPWPVLGIPGSLAVAWMDGRSPNAQPVGWTEQVLGTDLRSSAVLTLSPTFPHGQHTNFLYGRIACSGSGTKNVPRPDRTDVVPGRNSTRNSSSTITNNNVSFQTKFTLAANVLPRSASKRNISSQRSAFHNCNRYNKNHAVNTNFNAKSHFTTVKIVFK